MAEEHFAGRGERLLQHFPAHHRTPCLQRPLSRRQENLHHSRPDAFPSARGEREEEQAGQDQEGLHGRAHHQQRRFHR